MSGGRVDYNAKLAEVTEDILDRVKRQMLPLVARVPALDRAASDYVLAQDAEFESKRAKGGHVPIQLRDSRALDRLADIMLYEELTWSHADKMSIVEYPIMSDGQRYRRLADESPKGEIEYGDRTANGRRKSSFTDDEGSPQVRNTKMTTPVDDDIEAITDRLDLRNAIRQARLTDRQKQALWLVYGEDMTQERAGEVMGVKKSNVNEYIKHALTKIRRKVDVII